MRDCGLGDIETTTDVINKIVSPENRTLLWPSKSLNQDKSSNEISNFHREKMDNPENLALHQDKHQIELMDNIENKNVEEAIEKTEELNVDGGRMATVPHLGSLISISEVKKPEDRLLLLGGCKSFLENMKEHNCLPDIKTFTQLLDCIPDSLAAEQELMADLKKHKLKPDIDFYNLLMKKRSMRADYEGAKVSILYI